MSQLSGLNGVISQLKQYGFHSSAMASCFEDQMHYFGWYKSDAYIEESHMLEHLGALIRMMHENDSGPKVFLNLGTPARKIVEVSGVLFRHLTLEEQARFQRGYDSPTEHFDNRAKYDHTDGKPLS